jgi:periplasmic protein TonB
MRNRCAASIKTQAASLHDAPQHGREMGRKAIRALRLDGKRWRRGPTAPRRRFLLIAVALSVAVHLMAAALIVYGPRVLPAHTPPPEQGEVELLMVEHQGAQASPAAQPQETQPTPPQPERKPQPPPKEAQKPETPTPAPPPAPAPPVVAKADEPAPPPVEQTPPREAKTVEQPEAQQQPTQPAQPTPPTPPKTQDAPVFDLTGTESESNAQVLGGHVLPASPDDRFRNRPPIYPREAAVRGEHGSVLLMIHVSESGFATGADVVESSGVSSLDQAATTAVLKWHFRPALQDGRAVPFDMPFRFVFEAD